MMIIKNKNPSREGETLEGKGQKLTMIKENLSWKEVMKTLSKLFSQVNMFFTLRYLFY